MASNVFNTFSEKCGSPTEFAAQAKKRLNEIIKKITPGELALYEAAVKANHEGTRTFLARIDEMAHWRQFPLVVVCDYKGELPLDELRKVRSNVNKANFSILEAGSIRSFLNHNPDKELLKVMGEVEAAREVLGEERTSALAGHAQSFQEVMDVLEREFNTLREEYKLAAAQIPDEFQPVFVLPKDN